MMTHNKKAALLAIITILFWLAAGFAEMAEARSRSGGRSFGRSYRSSPSYSRPAMQPRQPSGFQTMMPRSGGSFGRGLVGGIMGGFIGNMLFGGMARGHGMGGFGGSGIGLFELLIFGGLLYFLFRRSSQKAASPGGLGAGNAQRFFNGLGLAPSVSNEPPQDSLVAGVKQIWTIDETFRPDEFTELAQDLFFKIQAGWTRRDAKILVDWVGDQLLGEYDMHFAEMRQKGEVNRLENISVRKVELINAGVENNAIFAAVEFTANLLDYTVDEHTGAVLRGDPQNPVKFEEKWTFSRPIDSRRWKLEGIEA